jgi:two-component system cell cycle response regulator DivK
MSREAAPLVLLAEDNDDNRDVYAQYLRHIGWRVETAIDGEEAVEKAASVLPDVVVLDLSMPRMSGWDACRRIKADPRTAGIPVIAVSAHAERIPREQAEEAGCDAYYAKPLAPDKLLSAVQSALRAKRRAGS